MAIPRGLENVLSMDPEVMHGQVCFQGTRVPLSVLLDNLDEGMSVDEFLQEYPSVSLEQISAVIAWQQNRTREAAGLQISMR